MTYKEIQKDVFDYHDRGYYLVHCISADFKLGAGIAATIEKRYHVRSELFQMYGTEWYREYDKNPDSAAILHAEKRIIDLVTKTRYWHKPTMASMHSALLKLKHLCEKNGIHRLAMPKIGCGLDMLDWSDVSDLIKAMFNDTDIDIVICYL